jgi:hypothetical protein
MNGLPLSVLVSRGGYDTTNNGVSAKFNRLTLVGTLPNGKKVPEVMAVRNDAPAVEVRSIKFGDQPEHFFLVPVDKPEEKTHAGPMFGGNYAVGLDSRWRALGFTGPIAIHDRFETWAQYEMLSA